MELLDLPLELVQLIVEDMVVGVGLYKAIRLRLLNKFFDREVLQALFKDGIIDYPANLRTSWMTASFTTKLAFAKAKADSTVRKSVVTGAIHRAIELLRDGDGYLDEELRLQYTHGLCAAMVAQRYISHVRDDLYIPAEDKVKYISEENDYWSALAAVVSVGDIPKLRELLNRDIPNYNPDTELCGLPTRVAAGQGQYAVLQYLLERGFYKDEAEHFQSSRYEYNLDPALVQAAGAGHEDIIRLLLTPKYGLESSGTDYESAILAASRGGFVTIIQFLITHATNMDISHVQRRLFFEAAFYGHAPVVQLMLDTGIQVDTDDGTCQTALEKAAVHGNVQVIRLLLTKGAPSTGYHAAEALVRAAKNGHEAAVQVLLDAGADIDAKGRRDNPLGAAACYGEARMIRFLLEKGADLMPTKFGQRGLCVAAVKGHEAVVRVLVEAGIDVNGPEDQTKSPMLNALSAGQMGIVRLLRQLGATEVDPLKSVWREEFESGTYPMVQYHE
ncbi:MAG: hypothetical protein M1835_003423 [Candelina submexicana]|nr:MAG: hypothetical protein M1835_003423 [Candelina submexicana]